MMTGQELVNEVLDAIGKRADGLTASSETLETKALRYLNWGQKTILGYFAFPEFENLKSDAATVADVKRYPLETGTNNLGLTNVLDIQSIRLIDDSYSRTIKRWGQRKFDKAYPYPEKYTTDRPSIYIVHGNYIEFFKIPDDAYTLHIRYIVKPTEITLATTNTDFDDRDKIVVTAGVYEFYKALQEYKDVTIWKEILEDEIKKEVRLCGDRDWEPRSQQFGEGEAYQSGEPWIDPFGGVGDPLFTYPE